MGNRRRGDVEKDVRTPVILGDGVGVDSERARLAVVENEFASVTISLDTAGHSPRLHVQDNETGDAILLSAIELASLCLATSEDRLGWLRVGLYRGEPE
jgi:hypothetical protein